MRCDEVHKSSDGTLHHINLGLATEKKRLELEVQKTGHWINPTLLIDKVFRITEHRLEHRNVLRRLESFYGLRKIEGSKYQGTSWNREEHVHNFVNRIIYQHKNPTIDEFKVCSNFDKNAKGAISNWTELCDLLAP
ncbi:hypothetical protein OSB04_028326 [Centaurea solstitialis]|uniref:Uncharacterized protein n=1 Tax=Centaurea solstitialis TaxID=347529 RepID=A0AA38W7L8_9ASTR|nr:hypothetical protein OSB04_028326 [Centaurea solstitialis]